MAGFVFWFGKMVAGMLGTAAAGILTHPSNINAAPLLPASMVISTGAGALVSRLASDTLKYAHTLGVVGKPVKLGV